MQARRYIQWNLQQAVLGVFHSDDLPPCHTVAMQQTEKVVTQ